MNLEKRSVSLHKEIQKLKENGKTIIIASHDMAEIESLCDKIAILKNGKIAFNGTPTELTNTYLGKSKILIKTKIPIKKINFNCSDFIEEQKEYFIFTTTNIGDALLELLQYAKETKNEIVDIKIERATLEQRFIEIATEDTKS